MRARPISAAAVLAVAATLLAGCRSNVNVAATVSGHRISESDVNQFVTTQGPTAEGRQQAAAQNTTPAPPKAIVLQYLVQEQVFEQTLRANGGLPSEAELHGRHDEATQLFFQNPGGAAFDRTLAKALPDSGIKASFVQRYVRTLELEDAVVQKLRLSAMPELVAAAHRAGVTVRISARYGTWAATTLSIDSSDSAGLPDYLKLQPTSAPSAQLAQPAP